MFFKHFASKKQLPGFYVSGTLIKNRLVSSVLFFLPKLFLLSEGIDVVFIVRVDRDQVDGADIMIFVKYDWEVCVLSEVNVDVMECFFVLCANFKDIWLDVVCRRTMISTLEDIIHKTCNGANNFFV